MTVIRATLVALLLATLISQAASAQTRICCKVYLTTIVVDQWSLEGDKRK